MPRTVVVLPVAGEVLPAAALPALRAAERVYADATVPEKVAIAAGAVAEAPAGADWVLLTADLTQAPEADEVIGAPRGAALLDAVAVMDRLRSPGGCPWDAEQTHESLLPYLVEECYELYQAIEDGDGAAMREELGDVLLQVLFHARVAAEAEADGAVRHRRRRRRSGGQARRPAPARLRRGTERIDTAERQEHRWEELKRAEKQRDSSVDGVPHGQPAVALAAKLVSRTARAGLPADLLPDGPGLGERLFADAARAKLAGDDPEAALRTAARRFADDVRAAERSARDAGLDPHALDADAWRAHWPSAPARHEARTSEP